MLLAIICFAKVEDGVISMHMVIAAIPAVHICKVILIEQKKQASGLT
jgi:hypothetical protein